MSFSRRLFLKVSLAAAVLLALFPWLRKKGRSLVGGTSGSAPDKTTLSGPPLGVDEDGLSHVYMSRNGTPEQNVQKVVEMMGGVEKFVGPKDIVVLKPNAQWWNQGMTNTDAMQGFIDMVLDIPSFLGEIIIADNHQFSGDDSRGWTTSDRNGKFNYNELVDYYQEKGHENVTKYHWHVGGRTTTPLEGDAQGNRQVSGPQEGDGYVWLEDVFYLAPGGRKCPMTYPVFTSAYSGITIDLKNGAWKNGSYLQDRKVRFINFSAINHHGYYCGVTASVKNLMGVVDMSCGFQGDTPENTFNTHHIGVSKIIIWKKSKILMRIFSSLGLSFAFVGYCYQNFHHTGGALGYFMRHVRMPDLNIITAERIGWGSRIDVNKSFQPKVILAGTDPVALDYIAARDVLLPGTPPDVLFWDSGKTYYELNNSENKDGPFFKFLNETSQQGIGTLSNEKIKIHEAIVDHA